MDRAALEAVAELSFELRCDSPAGASVGCNFKITDDGREAGLDGNDILLCFNILLFPSFPSAEAPPDGG